jgi:hypothetical protein
MKGLAGPLGVVALSSVLWFVDRPSAPAQSDLILVPFAVDAVRTPGVTAAQVLAYRPVAGAEPARLDELRILADGLLLHSEPLTAELVGDPDYGRVNALIERMPVELTELHRPRRYFALESDAEFAGLEAKARWEEIALRVADLRARYAGGEPEPFAQLDFPLPLDQLFDGSEPAGTTRTLTIEIDWTAPGGATNTASVAHVVRLLAPMPVPPPSYQAAHGSSTVHAGDLHVHSCHGEAVNACAPSGDCAAESFQTSGSFSYAQLKSQYQALGLDWFAATDHSYCIDDDSEYAAIVSEIAAINDASFIAYPDIELSSDEEGPQSGSDSGDVTCLFLTPQNHMGAHGITARKSGGGSGFLGFCSGLNGFQSNASAVRAEGGYPIVHHPESGAAFAWNSISATQGIEAGEMHGVEIWNGATQSGQGGHVGVWTNWLLGGRILYAYSGSDTHDAAFAFGSNNVLLTGKPFEPLALSNAVRGGRLFVSSGHFLTIEVEREAETLVMGTQQALPTGGADTPALVRAHYDFGTSTGTIRIFEGRVGAGAETTLCVSGTLSGSGVFECAATVSGSVTSYYRAYASGSGAQAYTNPVFFRVGTGDVASYCTAKTNSLGCVPEMSWNGLPSATLTSPFDLNATNVLNNKNGLLFYGFAESSTPFQGGTKCVAAPTRRTPVQSSGGNPPPNDCSGVYTYDFRARIQSGVDPNLTVGATAYAQYWSRDPQSASTTGLTDAVRFTIQP